MRSPRLHALWANENVPHFVTSVTHERVPLFRDREAANIVMEEFAHYAEAYDVLLIAAVVMPDHVHCIIWPRGKKTFSDYVRGVKSHSAKRIIESFENHRRGPLTPPEPRAYPSRPMSERIRRVWQDGFFDRLVRDMGQLERTIRYVCLNPTKDGIALPDGPYAHLYVHPDFRIFE